MTQEYKRYVIMIKSDKKEGIVAKEYSYLGNASSREKVFLEIEGVERLAENIKKSKATTGEASEKIEKIIKKMYETRDVISNIYGYEIAKNIKEVLSSGTGVLKEILENSSSAYRHAATKKIIEPLTDASNGIEYFISIKNVDEEKILSEEPKKLIEDGVVRVERVDKYLPKKENIYFPVVIVEREGVKAHYPLSFGIKRSEEESEADLINATNFIEDLIKLLASEGINYVQRGEFIKELLNSDIVEFRLVHKEFLNPLYVKGRDNAFPYLVVNPKKVSEYLSKK